MCEFNITPHIFAKSLYAFFEGKRISKCGYSPQGVGAAMAYSDLKLLDEVRERQLRASLAAQAVKDGRLPSASLDLAWALFGDQEIASRIACLVPELAPKQFDADVGMIKAELSKLLKRCQPTIGRDLPGEVLKAFESAEQRRGRRSSNPVTHAARMAGIKGKLPEYVGYLQQRVLYVALNQLLIELYSTPSAANTSSSKAKADWEKYGEDAERAIAHMVAEIKDAEREERPARPNDELIRPKVHGNAGRRPGKRKIPFVADGQQSDASLQGQPAAPVLIDAADAKATTPPVAPQVAPAETLVPNPQEPAVIAAAPEVVARATPAQAIDPASAPPTDLNWNKIIGERLGVATDNGHPLPLGWEGIPVPPMEIVRYFGQLSRSPYRLNAILVKLGQMPLQVGFGGVLNDEIAPDLYAALISLKRRAQAKTLTILLKSRPNNWPDEFVKALPEKWQSFVSLLAWRRTFWGGEPFNKNADPQDWWELTYGCDAYVRYTPQQLELGLHALALVDLLHARDRLISIEDIVKFIKPRSFYFPLAGIAPMDALNRERLRFNIEIISENCRSSENFLELRAPEDVTEYDLVAELERWKIGLDDIKARRTGLIV